MRIHSRIDSSQSERRGSLSGALLALLTTASVACGGGAVAQPVAPASGGSSASGGTGSVAGGTAGSPGTGGAPGAVDPFTVPAGPRDDDAPDPAAAAPVSLDAWQKAKKAKGVAPAPPACAAYATRAPGKEPADIVAAFAEKDAGKRDAMLVAIAKAPGASPAATRAQRADLAPVECADAIVDPLLLDASAGAGAKERPEHVRLLIGFSLAGKLARTASAPPAMGALRDKEKVKAFIGGPLKTWLLEQSTAIELLSSGAAGLSGYARGVAAIEAGIAELRLVDKMRSAPVPATWDPELKAIYEAALDEALEARKKRGRDAALVGMSDFARVGILRDARLERARTLLTKLYGGRRIDALDGLLLPAAAPGLAAAPGGSIVASAAAPVGAPTPPKEAALAAAPTFWLDTPELAAGSDPRTLSRGVTRAMRDRFRELPDGGGAGASSDDVRSAYARTRLDMGRVYWRRVDFVEAARAAKGSAKPEDRLVLAVALALAHGPNGAAEMMRAATPAALDLKHTEALDAVAAQPGPLAGMAAYGAAHLRSLSPPEGAEAAAYLQDVAARFRKAESLLGDAAQKKIARLRAVEIDAIVAAAGAAKGEIMPKP